jgi:hypothetical protein
MGDFVFTVPEGEGKQGRAGTVVEARLPDIGD